MERKQLTVGELIELLKTCPADSLVSIEGCDCCGDACGVTPWEGEVLITRTDGDFNETSE